MLTLIQAGTRDISHLQSADTDSGSLLIFHSMGTAELSPRGILTRIQAGTRDISHLQSADTDSGSLLIFHSMGTAEFSPRGTAVAE
jgi:hypothetical protein